MFRNVHPYKTRVQVWSCEPGSERGGTTSDATGNHGCSSSRLLVSWLALFLKIGVSGVSRTIWDSKQHFQNACFSNCRPSFGEKVGPFLSLFILGSFCNCLISVFTLSISSSLRCIPRDVSAIPSRRNIVGVDIFSTIFWDHLLDCQKCPNSLERRRF